MNPQDVQSHVLEAFGLEPWDIGAAPVPPRIRIWRWLTRAYQRGRAINWTSYNAAETAARKLEADYAAELPARQRAVADSIIAKLADGYFEYGSPDDVDENAG